MAVFYFIIRVVALLGDWGVFSCCFLFLRMNWGYSGLRFIQVSGRSIWVDQLIRPGFDRDSTHCVRCCFNWVQGFESRPRWGRAGNSVLLFNGFKRVVWSRFENSALVVVVLLYCVA